MNIMSISHIHILVDLVDPLHVTVRVPSMGQIELFNYLLRIMIISYFEAIPLCAKKVHMV